jgi:rSAM/selenodomain-associated transferase 1
MNNVIVFVKAPVAAHAKTRLIPLLGPEGAAEFSRAMALDTIAVVQQVPGVQIHVAYEAHPQMPDLAWTGAPFGLLSFPQAEGDLGVRLGRAVEDVYRRSGGPVVAIGTNVPRLSPELLDRAFEGLKSGGAAVGPNEGGGYYAIGLKQPAARVFEDIDWSTPAVLQQTLARLKTAGLTCLRLPVQREINTPDDFKALQRGDIVLDPSFKQTAAFLTSWKHRAY